MSSSTQKPVDDRETFGMPILRPRENVGDASTAAERPTVTLEKRKRDLPKIAHHKKELPPWVVASRPEHWGIRLCLWWVWKQFLYRFKWIPQPRPWGSYQRRTSENTSFCIDHRGEAMAIITVVAPKGGSGKTSRSTWGAVSDGAVFHTVLLCDLDTIGNNAAVRRLSCTPENTMSIDRVAHMITTAEHPWVPSFSDLVTRLESYPGGVWIFRCPSGFKPTVSDTCRVIEALKKSCHTLWVDTGPGVSNDATAGAVRASTIRMLTVLYKRVDSIRGAEIALDHPPYGMKEGDRLRYTLIAVSGVPWRAFNTRTQYEYAERFGVRPDQIVLIPVNQMQRDEEPVRPTKLGAKSGFAESWLTRRRVELAIEYNLNHPSGDLEHERDSFPGADGQSSSKMFEVDIS